MVLDRPIITQVRPSSTSRQVVLRMRWSSVAPLGGVVGKVLELRPDGRGQIVVRRP